MYSIAPSREANLPPTSYPASVQTGLASVIAGVSASNIDNVVVTDASTRRLGAVTADATAARKSGRRLATATSVAFDISLSTSASASFTDSDAFEEAVIADLQDAQTDSADLVTAIQDAATSTTFDAVPTSSAVTLGAVIMLTRPPTSAPSAEPTPAPTSAEPTPVPTAAPTADWIVAWEEKTNPIDVEHYIVSSVTTVAVAGFSVFCYYTHPSKDKVGLVNLPLPVWAWLDFGEWW